MFLILFSLSFSLLFCQNKLFEFLKNMRNEIEECVGGRAREGRGGGEEEWEYEKFYEKECWGGKRRQATLELFSVWKETKQGTRGRKERNKKETKERENSTLKHVTGARRTINALHHFLVFVLYLPLFLPLNLMSFLFFFSPFLQFSRFFHGHKSSKHKTFPRTLHEKRKKWYSRNCGRFFVLQ